MLRMMDDYCVDVSCLMGGSFSFHNGVDFRRANDFLLEVVGHDPERLIPFAHFNPNFSLETIRAELDRVYNTGVRAIKLINAFQHYPADGPNMMAIYAFAETRGMLVLNHYWSEDEIHTIAIRFPKLVMIRGHGGASPVSRAYKNVYDNIWSLHRLGAIESGIQRYGPDKILFGSDAIVNDPAVGIGLVVYANISDDAKRAVLGLNMARLLDRAGALPASHRHWLA
jgi:predicted TIM-barrel fold metal-dependent hydrolase